MHRREIITNLYPEEDDCCWALKIFWSIYVLDRRWSFGTGMPFAIQDADIDPTLPEPVCPILFFKRADILIQLPGMLPSLSYSDDFLQPHIVQSVVLGLEH